MGSRIRTMATKILVTLEVLIIKLIRFITIMARKAISLVNVDMRRDKRG